MMSIPIEAMIIKTEVQDEVVPSSSNTISSAATPTSSYYLDENVNTACSTSSCHDGSLGFDTFKEATRVRRTELIVGRGKDRTSFFVSYGFLSEVAFTFSEYASDTNGLQDPLSIKCEQETPSDMLTFLRALIPCPFLMPVDRDNVAVLIRLSRTYKAFTLLRQCEVYLRENINLFSTPETVRLFREVYRRGSRPSTDFHTSLSPDSSLEDFILERFIFKVENSEIDELVSLGTEIVLRIYQIRARRAAQSVNINTLGKADCGCEETFFACLECMKVMVGCSNESNMQFVYRRCPFCSRPMCMESCPDREAVCYQPLVCAGENVKTDGSARKPIKPNFTLVIPLLNDSEIRSHLDLIETESESLQDSDSRLFEAVCDPPNPNTIAPEQVCPLPKPIPYCKAIPLCERRKKIEITSDYIDDMFVANGGNPPRLNFRRDMVGKEVEDGKNTFLVHEITSCGRSALLSRGPQLVEYNINQYQDAGFKIVPETETSPSVTETPSDSRPGRMWRRSVISEETEKKPNVDPSERNPQKRNKSTTGATKRKGKKRKAIIFSDDSEEDEDSYIMVYTAS